VFTLNLSFFVNSSTKFAYLLEGKYLGKDNIFREGHMYAVGSLYKAVKYF